MRRQANAVPVVAKTPSRSVGVSVADTATGEDSKAMWHRWSVERHERERGERLRERAAVEAGSERAIYPLEIARDVAGRYGDTVVPEWRYLRDLVSEEYGRILKEQPEMRQRDVKAREQIIVALFNALPAHLHGALTELRALIELVSTARETTTFLLGYELGREAGRRGVLRDPRVMLTPEPARRALPAAHFDQVEVNCALRIHAADEEGGAQ